MSGVLEKLAGGHSGETFQSEQFGQQVVVRIYGERSAWRGSSAVDVDAAVLHLMRGIVPVPDVLEVRRPEPDRDLPAVLVTELLPGERADLVLPSLDGSARRALGERLGEILDRLAHIPTPRAGRFVGRDLVVEPWPAARDLGAWVDDNAAGLASWPADDLSRLRQVADRAQDLLDGLDRTCFVHSDFNAKNLLVDPETLEVTGVLDWEYAHSGSPATDAGNLLRFERDPDLAAGLLARWTSATLDQARAADLFALVDLSARDHDDVRRNPVTTAAHRQLRAIARTGDLHAVGE
jgi:aminoglycoside phosphotransferase (APT) family kinase protein